ncbi:anti-sigma-I factor RsgI family protein [Clostridium pasteurianum]|uniref:Anti-sigma factor RsgI-like middle domain-containing protein n=1 Tax=Clostridium pasteurianum BC1 TaxID=86416 RepID=R4KG23_CLOPA|nr:hypothetical protein [Clostridium pasteurianum]AGK98550.1 hypothetical protein Clopa_3780 [Clostridium pasteurianum BC1]
MITRFKSALDQIKVEDALISKTEVYLKDSLTKNRNSKINEFIKWRLVPLKKKLAIATCCLVVLLTLGVGSGVYSYYQTPVSYLSLDINPSVELGINTFGRVVKAEGYNNDGKNILNGINVKGSDITTAVDTLVTSAVKNGYIAKDGSTVISFTSETDDKNTATNLETEAETGANEALTTSGEKAEVLKDNVALARRDEARKLGITPGKLNLIQKLQKVDPTATVDQYKDAKVKDIMKAIQNNTDNGAVNNNDKGTVDNKDEGTVNNTDNGAVNNKDEDAVNNNDKGTVESKKQTIDKGNTVDTTKSVKNDNVDNGHGKGNNGKGK